MEYNTQREHLPMPEYGRSVQEMIDHALCIEDKAERQRCAESIISIMWGMFPTLRDVPDFQVKLWDHLAYMADYKLDIDYPFEITRLDKTRQIPEHIDYFNGEIRFRHYGRIIPELIEKAVSMENGPEKSLLVRLIAAQMKKDLLLWNKEMAEDSRIVEDIRYFSKGRLEVDAESISMSLAVSQNASQQGGRQQSRQFQRNKKNRKRY